MMKERKVRMLAIGVVLVLSCSLIPIGPVWGLDDMEDEGVMGDLEGPDYVQPPKYYKTLEMMNDESEMSGPLLGPPPVGVSGTRDLLVILVELSDATPNAAHTIAYFEDRFFDTTPPSVRDYYNEVSYGTFTYDQADVLGWYPSASTRAQWDSNPRAVVIEAIGDVDDDFNFAPYDTNGNNMISNEELTIFIIVSGNVGGAFHWWTVNNVATDDTVNVEGEFSATHENRHIGSYCHELGHDLGLPDLYDTNGGSAGIGNYGLMGGGSWTFAQMTAWSKIQLGWITPTIVEVSGWYDVHDVETNAEAFILRDESHSMDEYFLVENRRPANSDYENIGAPVAPSGTFPDEGIVIYHIDEAQVQDWINSGTNNVNVDEAHKGVDVECSDFATSHVLNADDLDANRNRGDANDLWDIGEYDFDDDSTPCNAQWYGNTDSGMGVGDFPPIADTMTVFFTVPEPVFPLDLIFTIDSTGSMWDDIDAVMDSATLIINEIFDTNPDARIAIVDYKDYPVSPYGEPTDYTFNDVIGFSTNEALLVEKINDLDATGGLDWPESVFTALLHSIDATSLGGWRGDTIATKAIILMGDAPPHDPEPFEGYTTQTVLDAAEAADPVIIYSIPVGSDPNCYSYFSQLAEGTNGQTFTAPTATDVVDALMDALQVMFVSPVADVGGPYTGTEGTAITFDASGSTDPNDNDLEYRWKFNGAWSPWSSSPLITHTWYDDYSGDVTVEVTDGPNTDTDSITVTVNNVAPTVNPITAPLEPVKVGVPVNFIGTFSDPGTEDTHTIEWDFGDDTGTSGTLTPVHPYEDPGVYKITLTVKDDNGGVGSNEFRYVVVYDPEGGFVTGGGWIDSPEGAYHPDPTLTGKASFGFVSKYKKGASTPTGKTEFQFHAADLNFHSNEYEWLAIAGRRAMYKGTGTINDDGEYKFLLTAIDGDLKGGDGIGKFRMKIWYEETEEDGNDIEHIVYDNGEDPQNGEEEVLTELGGGQIVIHTKGK
jgi:M6 family metalloprotease-like protein